MNYSEVMKKIKTSFLNHFLTFFPFEPIKLSSKHVSDNLILTSIFYQIMIRRDRTRLHNKFLSRVMSWLNHLWPPRLTQSDKWVHVEVLWGHLERKSFYGQQSKYHGVIVVCFLLFCFGNSTKECVPFTQRTGKSTRICV